MRALLTVSDSLDAIDSADPIGEAAGDISRGIAAVSRARRRLAHAAERLSYLAPSQVDGIHEMRRRLREEDAKLGAVLKISDPFGMDEPIDAALILEAHAPASVRQAAE